MDKQNVKFPFDGILFSNEEKRTHWFVLKQGWISKTLRWVQQDKCKRLHDSTLTCMIPKVQNVQKLKMYTDRKQSSGCLGLGMGVKDWLQMGTRELLEMMKLL